jgi:predicted MPP superfamily phosphohydrolase
VTLLYNFVMLAVDVTAIWLVNRRKGLMVWCGVMALAGLIALGLGVAIGWSVEDRFGVFRLWAYAAFVHAVLLLAATAVVWRRRPIWAGSMLAVAVALALIATDALLIEPYWLEVSHWPIVSRKIHRPMRIVVVADLQMDSFGAFERATLRQALAEKPDLILFAGDYIQAPPWKYPILKRELHDFLREIHFTAPRGVFAVLGNVDGPDWQDIFRGLGVTTIPDGRSFDLGDLQLTCLARWQSFTPDLRITNAQPDRFHLVVGHVPNFALGEIQADLLVAAHTHGGQVRFPFLGAVVTHSLIPNSWAAGLTRLPSGAQLLVCRGIGMEREYAPPIRFLCRPELMVIDLQGE